MVKMLEICSLIFAFQDVIECCCRLVLFFFYPIIIWGFFLFFFSPLNAFHVMFARFLPSGGENLCNNNNL